MSDCRYQFSASRKQHADAKLRMFSEDALAFIARSPSGVFGVEFESLDLLNDTPVVIVTALKYLYEKEGSISITVSIAILGLTEYSIAFMSEGLFRTPGDEKVILQIQNAIDAGALLLVLLSQNRPHLLDLPT